MRTALIAFDSKQFNLILGKMLKDLGFYVITATSGDELIDLCNQKKPNIMFLDWSFDKKKASDVFEKITYRPVSIFISTQQEPVKLQEALDMGVNEYIMKPFDNDILQSKLSLVGLL